MLTAFLGRFGWKISDERYGPWYLGRHLSVYVGRRWQWKLQWRSFEDRRWLVDPPVYFHMHRHNRRVSTVKVFAGPVAAFWDRERWDPRA